MPKRDRQRRPARRPAYRDPKPTILIVSEGKITEPEYIKSFAQACHNPRVKIEFADEVGVPTTVVTIARNKKRAAVRRARRENDGNLIYDEVWCVFDIDEHPKVATAKQMAFDNGIKLAISNPCIELWLYLHFADQPGMQHRNTLQQMLERHVPGYDKHVKYSNYADRYDAALKRASQLDTMAEEAGEAGRNPSTGIWRLTESIRDGS